MKNIFVSYSIKNKAIAGDIKKYIEEYDSVECFIAHNDIPPGSQYEQEILINLENSNYFMPLQTNELIESYYCQQEAGFAIAKKIKIIPLIPDRDGVEPIGFYAKFQGFLIKTNDLRASVKQLFIKEGIIIADNTEELEKRLIIFETSNSFNEAGSNTRSLFKLEEQFTKPDILRIVEFTLKNGQILYSWDARFYLSPFFVKNSSLISKEQLEEFLRAG